MNFSKQFTQREKVLMVILAVLILAGGYFILVHRPVETALTSIAQQQANADNLIIVLEAKSQRLDEMRTKLEIIYSDPNAVEIPTYDNLQKVMVFLNKTLATTIDYDLSFQQVVMPEEGYIIRRTIDMTFLCPSYTIARTVVTQLHDSPYRCQLGNLAILPATNQNNVPQSNNLTQGTVSVNLSITFFELKQ